MKNFNIENFREQFDALPRHEQSPLNFLKLLVESTDAVGGNVWNTSNGRAHPTDEFIRDGVERIEFDPGQRANMVQQAAATQQTVFVRPNTDPSAEVPSNVDQAAAAFSAIYNPWLVLIPSSSSGRTIELVFLPDDQFKPDAQIAHRLAAIGLLLPTGETQPSSGSVGATGESATLPLGESGAPATGEGPPTTHENPNSVFTPQLTPEQFNQFSLAVHKTIDPYLTPSNVANEARRTLGCDRISVVLKRRGRYRIVAVSGQPKVHRRSNLIRRMEKLASRTLRMRQPFWFPSNDDSPPQIQQPLDEYLVASPARSLAIIPISQRQEEVVADPDAAARPSAKILGGIIYEHLGQVWEQEQIEPVITQVTLHGSNALCNSLAHRSLFFYPLWHWLGKSRILTSPRHIRKTVLAAIALLVLSLLAIFWQVPFYVSAEGVLVPAERQWVFSQTTGNVQKVSVEHGSVVAAGDELVRVKNLDLKIRLAEVTGRLESLRDRKRTLDGQRMNHAIEPKKSKEASENLQAIAAEISSLQQQQVLLKELMRQQTVVAPVAGEVITWDVKRKLLNQSVQPQNLLMEIANPEGPWELELDIPDRRIGHLIRGLEQNERLKVEFTLAAEPNRTYRGTIGAIDSTLRLNEERQSVYRVQVELDESDLAFKKARAVVTAKVYCGYDTSFGYLWLHDLPESFNRYVLFWLVG